MNWIASSALMFASSIALYLLVRKSTLLKTSSPLNNLAMFSVPSILLVTLALSTGSKFTFTPYQIIIMVIQSFFFSYLGNVMSLKSIELAPNPGYSLVLSKSYVVFTSLVAVFWLDAILTTKAIIAIIFIVIFSAMVMINKSGKYNEHSDSKWLPLAVGSFFCWGMLSLSSKYLYTLGVSVADRLAVTMTIVTVLILTEMIFRKVPIKGMGKNQLLTLLGIGILGTTFNYYMQVAINDAPNVGYVNAINAASIAGVTIMAALIFKDELNVKKVIGVIGVVAGLILLVL